MTMLVRIKPYDPKRGHVVRRYTVSAWNAARFEEQRGWYEVPDTWADYLRTLKQNPSDRYSPDLFDVCTHDEANRINERERAAAEERAAPNRPYQIGLDSKATAKVGALTTADLPKASWESGDAGEVEMSPQPAAPSLPQPLSQTSLAPEASAPAAAVKPAPRRRVQP